jgi:hypothetical protein
MYVGAILIKYLINTVNINKKRTNLCWPLDVIVAQDILTSMLRAEMIVLPVIGSSFRNNKL